MPATPAFPITFGAREWISLTHTQNQPYSERENMSNSFTPCARPAEPHSTQEKLIYFWPLHCDPSLQINEEHPGKQSTTQHIPIQLNTRTISLSHQIQFVCCDEPESILESGQLVKYFLLWFR